MTTFPLIINLHQVLTPASGDTTIPTPGPTSPYTMGDLPTIVRSSAQTTPNPGPIASANYFSNSAAGSRLISGNPEIPAI